MGKIKIKPFAWIKINGVKYPLSKKDLIGKPITSNGKVIGKITDVDLEKCEFGTMITEGSDMPVFEFGVDKR